VKRRLIFTGILAAASLILMSWGYQGHYRINENAALSFNAEMNQFLDWAGFLAGHGSDADDRKKYDNTEAPKHYIDIDAYPEFVTDGRIASTYDSVASIHGSAFILDNGTLPWATKATYDTLVSCFKRRDWEKAKLTAADLGHYVGDGHMPLHITKNYNGQLSGNSGIHSRYESSMINAHVNDISYGGEPIEYVQDVQAYIFNYLYRNYHYVDSVLIADDYATEIAGDTKSANYINALWNKTENFTVMLFHNASHALAELMYSAWVDAGKPMIDETTSVPGPVFPESITLGQNHPNPFTRDTKIDYTLGVPSNVTLEVKDLRGETIATLDSGYRPQGSYSVNWIPSGSPAGIYLLILNTDGERMTRKMILGQSQ
jgi:hypothetical protein